MTLSNLAAEAARDRESLERLYRSLYTPTYSYVRYRVEDRETAEDMTSQVFICLLERIASYDPARGPFKPWFYALTRNVIADHFRGRRLTLEPLRNFITQIFDPGPSPEEALVGRDRRASVLAALECLSARERDVLGLKYAFDLGNREIAEVTGLAESNVGVIVYRSLRKMRGILDRKEAEQAMSSRGRKGVVDRG